MAARQKSLPPKNGENIRPYYIVEGSSKEDTMSKVKTSKETAVVATEQVNNATTVSAPETLNQHCVDAFTTILVKGDKQVVDNFKSALNSRREQALATIRTNWDNGNCDKDGLPKGSAPNDLYNTVSEVERALLHVYSDTERVGIAASTVRQLIAAVCSEITRYKSELAGKSGKVSTKNSKADESYI
jgi:hypothetical protein